MNLDNVAGETPVQFRAVDDQAQNQALESLGTGSPEEATTALSRLLSVTQATYERRAQLEHALKSRVAIEQAKGIVAERYGLEPDEAFHLIRRAARTHRIKLHDLVRAIQPRTDSPPELVAVLPEESRPSQV